MGIILLPFILGIIIIGIVAIFKSVKLFRAETIKIQELLIGLLTSLILFGLICVIYIMEGQAWGLSPAFRIPFGMIFMPFVVHLLTQTNEKKQTEYISKILIVSVAITFICCILFYNILFELINYLGLKKVY